MEWTGIEWLLHDIHYYNIVQAANAAKQKTKPIHTNFKKNDN